MKEVMGIIDHRILLNFRIDPEVMKKNLPEEFTAKVVNGYAIGGICQVSLSEMRAKGMPTIVGTGSRVPPQSMIRTLHANAPTGTVPLTVPFSYRFG